MRRKIVFRIIIWVPPARRSHLRSRLPHSEILGEIFIYVISLLRIELFFLLNSFMLAYLYFKHGPLFGLQKNEIFDAENDSTHIKRMFSSVYEKRLQYANEDFIHRY